MSRPSSKHEALFSIEARSNQRWNSVLITSCLLNLEDYAKSFVRDVPYDIRFQIRKQQRKFDLIYASLEREVLMRKLSEALEIDRPTTHPLAWKTWFMAAVDDMDKQYLEIRKARKELFDYDPANDQNHGCDIDLELWRCDEMIDWTVDKPQLKPCALPTDAELREYEELRRAEAIMTEDEVPAAQEQGTPPATRSPCMCSLVCICELTEDVEDILQQMP
ncbi:hypothetical protein N431DRAFT_465918 [Stipitochalara longipes BDJ]|nr:hypothetical protein N431DRAFT_465918 [Stipitochalara longipes BDJ]